MKIYLLLLVSFFLSITLNAQESDIFEKYDSKVLQNKTLQDSISILTYLHKIEYAKNDSIISNLNNEKKTLEENLKNVKDLEDKKVLTNQIDELKDSIATCKDELSKLKTENKTRYNLLEKEKQNQNIEINGLKNNDISTSNKMDATLTHLKDQYNQDKKLIFKQNIENFKSDLTICNTLFPEQKELKKSIQELKKSIQEWITIKKSEELLSRKFRKRKIEQHLVVLSKLTQFPVLEKLIKDLKGYGSKNESVKSLINQLESENGIKVKGTNKLQIEDKQGKVFTTIYFEVAYAPVDLNTYVYLRQIIENIKLAKLKDIDASLTYILEEL